MYFASVENELNDGGKWFCYFYGISSLLNSIVTYLLNSCEMETVLYNGVTSFPKSGTCVIGRSNLYLL